MCKTDTEQSAPTTPPIPAAAIASTGISIPEKVMTNADFEKMVDTTDEWITTRTGIKERRIAAENQYTSDMGAEACQAALDAAGVPAEDVDLIIVATSTPDTMFPSTACHIQHKLGATKAAGFDLLAACSGFVYGYIVARQFLAAGTARNILLVGAEKLSTIVDYSDRNTCVLFGDGAGAVLLNGQGEGGLLGWDFGCDGSQTDILSLPAGGCRMPVTPEVIERGDQYLKMAGREVYKCAVTAMVNSAQRALAHAGLTSDDIACIIPHQANLRIIQSVAEKLGFDMDRVIINLDRYGNTSAACIPVALHESKASGVIKTGDKVLFVAFGGGLTWASTVVEV